MAAEQKFILDTFFGADPFPVPPEPLVPRLNKAMYAGGGSPEALAAWDKELGEKCGHFFDKLDAGDFDSWADTPEGLLATVVLCDQMSRNIFRDTARAWAYDARAQAALKKAIENPVFLDSIMKMHPAWAYNLIHVFLHAENMPSQDFGMKFALAWNQNAKEGKYGDIAASDIEAMENIAFYIFIHTDCIRRFGRFASRNKFLGRENSPEEIEALEKGTCFGAKGFDMKKAKEEFLAAKEAGALG